MATKLWRIAAGILLISVTLMAMLSCAQKPEPEYASPIAEGILLAMNENDYAKYSEHFDQAMKTALPESGFQQANMAIKDKIGDYISKQFLKVVEEGLYTSVYYKAKFTLEPEDVIVKVVFQEIEGKVYVSGLWFDSPKLRQ